MAGLAFSHIKKATAAADDKGKGKEKEDEQQKQTEEEKDVSARLYKEAIVSQVILSSMRSLLFSESPAATTWRVHLSKWLARVASQDLPHLIPLLADPTNPVDSAATKGKKNNPTLESFHDVFTLLSLLGGNTNSPLPGAKVELKVCVTFYLKKDNAKFYSSNYLNQAGASSRGCVVGLKCKEDGLVLAVSLEDKRWEYNVAAEKAVQLPEVHPYYR